MLYSNAWAVFQSTPPARAATLERMGFSTDQVFQSTPPARAATYEALTLPFYPVVSIHAAREGGDDQRHVDCAVVGVSIHAAREGGDRHAKTASGVWKCFNPRRPRGRRLVLR